MMTSPMLLCFLCTSSMRKTNRQNKTEKLGISHVLNFDFNKNVIAVFDVHFRIVYRVCSLICALNANTVRKAANTSSATLPACP